MIRVDQALVERGLCESREKAKRAVMAGQVLVNGQPTRKPSDAPKEETILAQWDEVAESRRLVYPEPRKVRYVRSRHPKT